jgi:tRNA 5-methylaminomethyl-2-thiouridine biosynthesis bifunctional protein
MISRAEIDWDLEGAPRSIAFDDVYFSKSGGLAESRFVFLEGCGLPYAWRERTDFVVGELGFGTGLNILALLDLWTRTRPARGRLHIFSLDAAPPRREEAERALAAWPELAPLAQSLLAQWPPAAAGFHRLDFPDLNASLDLALAPVETALAQWSGRADAWFLDGFTPARNPEMWSPEVMKLLARRSAPGARLATYTAAGAVRRALTEAGFAVEKGPGFGGKRERLLARLSGAPTPSSRPASIAILGAGIAGSALKSAYGALGVEARLIDPDPGGASRGHPVLVTPRLDAGLGPAARLFAQAWRRAGRVYQNLDAVLARQCLHHPTDPKDPARFSKIATSDLFAPEECALGEAGLRFTGPSLVDPAPALAEPDHSIAAPAEITVVAAGARSADFGLEGLLYPVRGQSSLYPGLAGPTPEVFGAYLAGSPRGLVAGATHDRHDTDPEERAADHERVRRLVAARQPEIAMAMAGVKPLAHVGLRAATGDYLPLAGPIHERPGWFALTGLGSRGFTLAPLLAEHVAALTLDLPSPLPADVAALVDPARFARRALRRAGGQAARA